MSVGGLSFGDCCRLFCCPPCPSSIAAKLAFLPPEPATYSIEKGDDGKLSLHLTERAEFFYTQLELDMIEALSARTQRRNTIGCMYVKLSETPKYTLLFSHGNAVDLGQMSSFYVGLGKRLKCNVFAYDYSGYGASTGSPGEANVYADAEAAWSVMTNELHIDPSRIIIYGQSIGTVASIDLATRHQCAGVILHSPLLSGMRVAFPNTQRSYFFDPFPSINKILRVQTVVLVIHGTEDEVIDFSHGLCLYERAPNTVDPLWIDGGGHNDIERYPAYLVRLIKFIDKELPAREAAAAAAAAERAQHAAASQAVAEARASTSSDAANQTALGDDGVMALARMDDNESDDSDSPEDSKAAPAGTLPAVSSQTSTVQVTSSVADDDSLKASSTDALLRDDVDAKASSGNSMTESNRPSSSLSVNDTAQKVPTEDSTDAGVRSPSRTTLPESTSTSPCPSPAVEGGVRSAVLAEGATADAVVTSDMTVMTKDGGPKSLADVDPDESMTLVYV